MPANKYEWAESLCRFNSILLDMMAAQHQAYAEHMATCLRPMMIHLGPSSQEKIKQDANGIAFASSTVSASLVYPVEPGDRIKVTIKFYKKASNKYATVVTDNLSNTYTKRSGEYVWDAVAQQTGNLVVTATAFDIASILVETNLSEGDGHESVEGKAGRGISEVGGRPDRS